MELELEVVVLEELIMEEGAEIVDEIENEDVLPDDAELVLEENGDKVEETLLEDEFVDGMLVTEEPALNVRIELKEEVTVGAQAAS